MSDPRDTYSVAQLRQLPDSSHSFPRRDGVVLSHRRLAS